ncbi:MAG: LysR family transcriptional regulator [Aestuariibacter sp.]
MDKIDTMRVFVVVARHGSFTNAARELNMPIQTVSKYVKSLESRLNVQLFDRTTRKVALNHTGKAYLDKCIALLETFDEVEADVTESHHTPKGKVRITAPTAFGEMHLLPVIGEFLKSYPQVSFDVELTNRKVRIVEEGFDIAVRIGMLADSGLIAKKLADTRLVVCASPTYLAECGEPLSPMELKHHNCLFDSNLNYGKSWVFNQSGEDFRVEVEGNLICNTPTSIKNLALSHAGIGLCPLYVIKEDVVSGRLKVLFPQYEAFTFGIYALYPHRKHLSARIRIFIDYLAAKFSQY